MGEVKKVTEFKFRKFIEKNYDDIVAQLSNCKEYVQVLNADIEMVKHILEEKFKDYTIDCQYDHWNNGIWLPVRVVKFTIHPKQEDIDEYNELKANFLRDTFFDELKK